MQGGAGATSLAAIQFAREGGATVLATVSSEAKAEAARQAGAHHVLDYRAGRVAEAVMDLTQGRGVDQVLEVNLAANAAVDGQVLAPDGWLVMYGSPGDFTPRLHLMPALFKQVRLRLVGSFTLSARATAAALADIWDLQNAGRLSLPVAGRFAMADAAAAHALQDGGHVIGNVLVDVAAVT